MSTYLQDVIRWGQAVYEANGGGSQSPEVYDVDENDDLVLVELEEES